MNICFFLTSSGWGGAQNVVYNLAKFMRKRGYKINIVLNEETYPFFKDLEDVNLVNIGPVFCCRKILKNNFGISLHKSLFNYEIFVRILRFFLGPLLKRLNYRKIRRNILETIDTINPDVIHFHNPVVLEFCSHVFHHLKYPMIYTAHGLDFENNNLLDKVKDSKKRKLLMKFDKITAVSEYAKEHLILNGVESDIDVIYNGVDLELFGNILMEKHEMSSNKEELKLIFPGGQKKQKGGEILLKALKKIEKYNIKLFYCGEVDNRFINSYQGEKVIFTGLLPRYDYLELLSECNCLVLLSRWEAFPLSVLEAMALGKTVITTAVGGIANFFKNGVNGLVVKREPQDVADKIVYLYKNRELQKRISKRNLQDVKKFDWNNIVDQYLDLYESIIS